MNSQDGNVDVVPGRAKDTVVLFASSAIRSIIVAAVAKLSPSLVDDPAVKWLVEMVAIALAVTVMAWISTRSTLKRVGGDGGGGDGGTGGGGAQSLELEVPRLTGSRVGSIGDQVMKIKQALFASGLGTMGVVVLGMVAAIAALAGWGCANSTVGSDHTQTVAEVHHRNGPPNELVAVNDEGTRSIQTVGPVSETELEIPWDLEAVQLSGGEPVQVGTSYAKVRNRNGGVASREIITKFLGAPFLLRSGDGFKVSAARVSYDPTTKMQIVEGLSIESRVDESTRAMNDLSVAFSDYAKAVSKDSAATLQHLMDTYRDVAPSAVKLIEGALTAFGLPAPGVVLDAPK